MSMSAINELNNMSMEYASSDVLPAFSPRLKRTNGKYYTCPAPVTVIWQTGSIMYRDQQWNLLPVPIVSDIPLHFIPAPTH